MKGTRKVAPLLVPETSTLQQLGTTLHGANLVQSFLPGLDPSFLPGSCTGGQIKKSGVALSVFRLFRLSCLIAFLR